jgi:hypothetical protein
LSDGLRQHRVIATSPDEHLIHLIQRARLDRRFRMVEAGAFLWYSRSRSSKANSSIHWKGQIATGEPGTWMGDQRSTCAF